MSENRSYSTVSRASDCSKGFSDSSISYKLVMKIISSGSGSKYIALCTHRDDKLINKLLTRLLVQHGIMCVNIINSQEIKVG